MFGDTQSPATGASTALVRALSSGAGTPIGKKGHETSYVSQARAT